MKTRKLPYLMAALALTAAFAAGVPAPVAAQGASPALNLGGLGDLARAKQGRPRHESSWDRKGGNGDLRRVAPGETLPLLDFQGAGIIRRFWVTIAPRSEMVLHRQLILRMYWDGEETPSVEAPIGDFFGVGFGEQVDYQSTPLNQTSGGYNCYWPMPFHKRARWTLTNMSAKTVDAFYYNIDFTEYKKLPKDMLHFHAQWRRENPTTPNKNYTLLDAKGRGHFVGAAMYMQNRRGRGLGFLEGDEMFYIDGEKEPSIYGTGTEDYFSSGWYYDRGPYSAPQHGVNLKDTRLGRISTYRWHIDDAMPFKKSFLATIEHGHANDHEGDYSSIAFWYQTEPHAPFPAFPTNAALLLPYTPPAPTRIQGAVEAESLLSSARATNGPVEFQDMSVWSAHNWSNDEQLWWRPTMIGAVLTLNVPAPADGEYELTGYFSKAKDYGHIQVLQGETRLGAVVNLYDPEVRPTGPVTLGRVRLKAGNNPLQIRVMGKDTRSGGFLVGIDAFVLERAG